MGKLLRTLIISSSEEYTSLLLKELKHLHQEVHCERVATPDQLGNALLEKEWDLVLSEYSLLETSAAQALQDLKTRNTALHFLLVSSPVNQSSLVAVLQHGSDEFLVKGRLAELASILEAEIGRAAVLESQQAAQIGVDQLGMAFHLSPVGICTTTLDGRLEKVNQALVDMLGFASDELEGKHFNDITHPDDREIGKDAVASMLTGKSQSVSFEKRYLHKNGEPVWALVTSSLLRDSSGEPLHFITHILNISKRKSAEAEARIQAAHLKVLAEASETFVSAVADVQSMLEMVARQVAEALETTCGVRLLSDDGQWLEMVALYTSDPEALEVMRMLASRPLPVDEPTLVQVVMQKEQAFLMPGVPEEHVRALLQPEHLKYARYVASRSRLIAPMRAQGKPIGFLMLSREPGSTDFNERDLRLANGLADRAALAISNGLLFKQVQNELAARNRAEAASIESQARYRNVLDAMMEGCQIIDFDWRYIYVNDVVAAQGRHTPEELLNHTMMEIYPGIENTELFTVLRQCMQERVPQRMENPFVFPDGSMGWFELSIQPAQEGIFILSTDITERKRAEAKLRQSEENFSKAFNSSPTALTITRRADGKYLALNRAYCSIVGYESSELLEHLTAEFPISTDPDQRKEILAQLTAHGALHNYEATIRNRGGELRTVLASLEQIQFNGEDCILSTLVDITERKQAEQRFRLVVESTPNAILLVNQNGLIEMVNSQTERFFGYERSELLGLHVDQLLPERLRAMHVNHRQEYFNELQARPMGVGRDLFAVRKDGSEFPVEIGLTPLTIREDVLVIATIVDITERKQAEDALLRRTEDLRRSNAELEQFAYVSSHDLQEPLRMVSSYVQLLAKRYKGKLDEDADVFIGYAVEGATRMQQLINDLLAYSRVGTQAKPFTRTDLETILDHALTNLQIAVQEGQAVVTHDPLPTLLADPVQMVQLFQNLIGNAIKFRGASPPRIHIRAERGPADWRFSIQDNGIGIDPQFAERIFIIFQRLNTRAEYEGTGIGLAICKKIVERHGGRIWVEAAPEQGSIFLFTLPDKGAQYEDV